MPVEIKLTRGKVALVDEKDAHLASYKWCLHNMGYAIRGFRPKVGQRATMFLHHAVIGRPLNGLAVDHIDGNRLNNTRANLRIVTRRQNAQNTRRHRGETPKSSKYLGVRIKSDKWGNKYIQSKIFVDGKDVHLGSFKTEVEAAQAYQRALKETDKTHASI